MAYISGFDRNQSFLFSLDNLIDENSPVRLIDCFVDYLDLNSLGFIIYSADSPGQKPYKCSDLLKLHIYGYVNGIRSSRKLSKECSRNIELMWLLNNVSPAKSCISDFIKNNKKPIKNLFKQFISFLKFADFVDAKADIIDGSKIRAQNSRNKYYSIKKIDATIDFFNSQIDKYITALQNAEASSSDSESIISFKEKISNYKEKLEQFLNIKKELSDKGINQITITDPDSRMMTSHGNSDISFNLQTSVDSKNSLIVACDVVNDVNDTNQLENMVKKTIENLDCVPEVSIADMGYFNAEQIYNCENLNTDVFVKRPKTKNSTNNPQFSIDKFKYIPDKNIYICPAGKELHFSRNLIKRKNKNDEYTSIVGFEYSCSDCFDCPFFGKCTHSLAGRKITRNYYQDTLDKVQKRFEDNPEMYTFRKCVVEHPFGTIKRSLGYTYFLRKGLESVRVEATLICLAYDFKRLTNIEKISHIKEKLEEFFKSLFVIFLYFYTFSQKTCKKFIFFYYFLPSLIVLICYLKVNCRTVSLLQYQGF